jgi:hypothetical protein
LIGRAAVIDRAGTVSAAALLANVLLGIALAAMLIALRYVERHWDRIMRSAGQLIDKPVAVVGVVVGLSLVL